MDLTCGLAARHEPELLSEDDVHFRTFQQFFRLLQTLAYQHPPVGLTFGGKRPFFLVDDFSNDPLFLNKPTSDDPTSRQPSLIIQANLSEWSLPLPSATNEFRAEIKGQLYQTKPLYATLKKFQNHDYPYRFLEDALKNQEGSVKTDRFLYHYTLLHRKIFKNVHKLTSVKRLFSGGFYNTKFLEKNIWASDTFAKAANATALLKTELELNYGNFFLKKTTPYFLLNQTQSNFTRMNYSRFSFYEESFFWFSKRVSLLFNLRQNEVKFSYQPYTKPSVENNPLSEDSNLINVPFALIQKAFWLPIGPDFNQTTSLNTTTTQPTLTTLTSKSGIDFLAPQDETVFIDLFQPPVTNYNSSVYPQTVRESQNLSTPLNLHPLSNITVKQPSDFTFTLPIFLAQTLIDESLL